MRTAFWYACLPQSCSFEEKETLINGLFIDVNKLYCNQFKI